jgi:hypothetical protein
MSAAPVYATAHIVRVVPTEGTVSEGTIGDTRGYINSATIASRSISRKGGVGDRKGRNKAVNCAAYIRAAISREGAVGYVK